MAIRAQCKSRLRHIKFHRLVWDVALSPDGSEVAAVGPDPPYNVFLFCTKTGKMTHELSGHTAVTRCVSYAPGPTFVEILKKNVQLFVTGSDDGLVRVWNATDKNCLSVLDHVLIDVEGKRHKSGKITCMSFSPDMKELACGLTDSIIRIWKMATCTNLTILCDHDSCVTWLEYSPDLRYLASCSTDRSVRLWVLPFYYPGLHFETDSCVWGVAFSPVFSGPMLSREEDGELQKKSIIRNSDGLIITYPQVGSKRDYDFVTTHGDGSVKRWVVSNEKCSAKNVVAKRDKVKSSKAIFSPDGKLVASLGHDGELVLSCAVSGKVHKTFGMVACFTCSKDGGTIVMGSGSHVIFHTNLKWSDRSHIYFSLEFRSSVFTLMCVQRRHLLATKMAEEELRKTQEKCGGKGVFDARELVSNRKDHTSRELAYYYLSSFFIPQFLFKKLPLVEFHLPFLPIELWLNIFHFLQEIS